MIDARPESPRRGTRARLAHFVLPAGTTADGKVLLLARAVRAFGDGFVSVLLPVYLLSLGFDAIAVGALSTATLLGSAVLTLLVGFYANRLGRRGLLLIASLLMMATGLGFASVQSFWPLLVIAFVGTLNPSSGDVSVFLPLEQSLLPQTTDAKARTALFARYSVVGTLAAAAGALCAGLPALLASRTALDEHRCDPGPVRRLRACWAWWPSRSIADCPVRWSHLRRRTPHRFANRSGRCSRWPDSSAWTPSAAA